MGPISKNPELSHLPAQDGRRELVRRVVKSSTFAKSKRLSSFLYFVCDQTLSGRSDELNEQRIGEHVFGRSRDYDSSIDGIVRTQGSRLRQRLDRYFSEEGVDEPVRIVIPRGGYVPLFEPRPAAVFGVSNPAPSTTFVSQEAGTSSIGDPLSVNPAVVPRSRRWLWNSLIATTFLVFAFFVRHHMQASAVGPKISTNPLWSRIFSEGRRTLIVPGDSGLVIWEGLAGRRLSLAEFLKGEYHNQPSPSPDSPQAIADDLSKRRYTSLVDLEVMQFMSTLGQASKGKLEMRYARDIRPNDLKDGSVVLVGANEANPWVELYEPLMKFTFFSNPATHTSAINNRSPQSGEPSRWDMGGGKAYAIVAYLPGLTDKGDSLIIGGTSMTGTESALDFVSDDAQLLPFLKRIQHLDGRLPHFQVVLGTDGVTGNSVRSQILAWRVTD